VERAVVLVTRSAADTRVLAAEVAALLEPGDLVALAGDLGSGKTTFVQGSAETLGVTDPVVSPTFTLVREYEGRIPVTHVDVYRLTRLQEVLDIGFEDYLDGRTVVFVEWADVIEGLLPESWLGIALTAPADEDMGADEQERTVTVSVRGPAWAPRWERLEAATAAWERG
jgi:tRNA threonylcarbamoyladenosine biosynthesis protein TsaE